jgi:3D (Asp-Asp-Asp) domain-containing protein
LAAVFAASALAAAAPVALGADRSDPRAQAETLRDRATSSASERQSALLDLYALESEVARARRGLRVLDARRARLAEEQATTRRQLAASKRAAARAHRRLEKLLRTLYEQQDPDPLAILLGAESLDEAFAGLESLDRAAADSRRILAQAQRTRVRLARVEKRLTRRKTQIGRLAAAARTRAAELEAAATARASYVESLRRREDLTGAEVTALEAETRSAQRQTALQPAATSPAAVSAAPAPEARRDDSGASTLTVAAIGYSFPGRTASGLPVGPGIVAVDPNVIPLGTRMYVPGYGEAVAADTGSSIRGNVIDLWFPSTAEAQAWGRRTVTITLH